MGRRSKKREPDARSPATKWGIVYFVVMNGVYQIIIIAYRKEVNAKAFFSLDIGVGMSMLVQVANHGEEGCLISVEAAPRMKAHIRLAVFFPGGNCKQNGRYSCCYFKVGEQLKFFRVGWLKILREILFNLYLHRCTFHILKLLYIFDIDRILLFVS